MCRLKEKVKIVSKDSLVLDLETITQSTGVKFKTTTGVYRVNQEFIITDNETISREYYEYNLDNGLYMIDSVYSGLRLESYGNDLMQNIQEKNNTQLWSIEKQSDGSYKVAWNQTGKVLTNNNGTVTLES